MPAEPNDFIYGLIKGARIQLTLNGIAFCGFFLVRLYADMTELTYTISSIPFLIQHALGYTERLQLLVGGLGLASFLVGMVILKPHQKRLKGYLAGMLLMVALTLLVCFFADAITQSPNLWVGDKPTDLFKAMERIML